jgi:hypothetical protein
MEDSAANSSFSTKKFLLSSIAQALCALLVLMIVYWGSTYMLKTDKIVHVEDEVNERVSTLIVPGTFSAKSEEFVFLTTPTARRLNTSTEYVHIMPSKNTKGGAQFTYTFWMKVVGNTDDFEQVVFLRGDKTRASFKSTSSGAHQNVMHPVAFCPMVRVVRKNLLLSIHAQFNTTSEYNNAVTHDIPNGSNFDVSEWHLVTITCVDGETYGEINGVKSTVWFDQVPVAKMFALKALRENTGNLYVNPVFKAGTSSYPKVTINGAHAECRNLTFHNYAFTSRDVFSTMNSDTGIVDRPYVPKPTPSNSLYTQNAQDLSEMGHSTAP